MIQQFQFALRAQQEERVPQAWAYRLYSWLLEQLPPEMGDSMHAPGARPITQHLHYSKEAQSVLWTVNLLGEEVRTQAASSLRTVRHISLNDAELEAELLCEGPALSAVQLIQLGREEQQTCTNLRLLSPCAFKQAGRYAVFPQENLLLQSLVSHWNDTFPEFPLSDPDALDALLLGIHIVGYDLHTVRYPLKGTRIPGAVGRITLESRLPLPLQELWNTLLAFAPYGGVGIKTTLGMGGVCLK